MPCDVTWGGEINGQVTPNAEKEEKRREQRKATPDSCYNTLLYGVVGGFTASPRRGKKKSAQSLKRTNKGTGKILFNLSYLTYIEMQAAKKRREQTQSRICSHASSTCLTI